MKYTFDDVKDILKTINDAGFIAYLVGGSVRDYLIYNNFNDIDIATDAKVENLSTIFNIPRYDKFAAKFGTFKAVIDGKKVEITTLRKEGAYEKRRHPYVSFVNDPKIDVERRDFTMNAIYMDQFKNVLDYYDGQKDIANRTIRCIGDADSKIKEDPVRILRAIRFKMTLDFLLDSELEKAIKDNVNLVDSISTERQKLELSKFIKIAPVSEIKKVLDFYNINLDN